MDCEGDENHSFRLAPLSSLLFRSVIQSLCFSNLSPPSNATFSVQNLPSIESSSSFCKTQNYPNIHAPNIVATSMNGQKGILVHILLLKECGVKRTMDKKPLKWCMTAKTKD